VSHEELFLTNLALIERVTDRIGRRQRLDEAEREEFSSWVKLKLIEDDYRILRRFRGRSRLSTYLARVITRLYLDFRVTTWGKFRPSAEARRLGPTAMLLERLIVRDGLALDQAIEVLRTNYRVAETAEQLRGLGGALPPRWRRSFLDDTALPDVANGAPGSDERLDREADVRAVEKLQRELREARQALPADDRLILSLRYDDGLSVADISRMLGLQQKSLYRRLQRILKRLRAELEARGVSAAAINTLMANAAFDLLEEKGPGSKAE
jgi:RNA polymerase sigma factor (sigma-70 family)